jgi:hypothetical protein
MVDKIDKTTLKILLFIVFLVILYLIVNRKNQIKEGFVLTKSQSQRREMIQNHLNNLNNNGFTLEDIDTIIGGTTSESDINISNVYSAMELYYKEDNGDYYYSIDNNIKKIDTDNTHTKCEDAGYTSLDYDECSKFRSRYVSNTKTSQGDQTFGNLITNNVEAAGHFKEVNNYMRIGTDGEDWIPEGCSYRSHEGNGWKYHFGLHYSTHEPSTLEAKGMRLICKKPNLYDSMIDKIEILLSDKESQTIANAKAIAIGKQYINIFKKIIEGYDLGDDENIFDEIIKELESYHKIDKEDMANLDDTKFIYPNCEAKNMISLNKKECSNFRKEYVSDTTMPKETKHGSMLTDNRKGNFKQENGYMRLGDSAGNWMPKGCSYRAGGGDKGIHYSDNDPDYNHKNTSDRALAKYDHISKFDLFCKIDINTLTTLSSLITEPNNFNLRDILDSILKLLNTENPLTDDEINVEITNLQHYIDTHIDNEKEKLTSEEHNTMMKSQGFF